MSEIFLRGIREVARFQSIINQSKGLCRTKSKSKSSSNRNRNEKGPGKLTHKITHDMPEAGGHTVSTTPPAGRRNPTRKHVQQTAVRNSSEGGDWRCQPQLFKSRSQDTGGEIFVSQGSVGQSRGRIVGSLRVHGSDEQNTGTSRQGNR